MSQAFCWSQGAIVSRISAVFLLREPADHWKITTPHTDRLRASALYVLTHFSLTDVGIITILIVEMRKLRSAQSHTTRNGQSWDMNAGLSDTTHLTTFSFSHTHNSHKAGPQSWYICGWRISVLLQLCCSFY